MFEQLLRLVPFSHNKNMRQFYKYSIVGLSNTLIDFLIYVVLTRTVAFFATYFLLANVLSFGIAVTNSYIWNRRWTFRSTDAKRFQQYMKFFIVNIGGLLLNTGLLSLLVYKFGVYDIMGKVIAIVISLAWNFLLNRIWVFKDS